MTKRLLIVAAIIVTAILGGLWLQQALIDEPVSPAPSPPRRSAMPAASATASAVDGAQRIVVSGARGTVERRDATGQWVALRLGDELSIDDVVRTGPGASAELDLGGRVTISVADQTEVALAQVSRSLSRVRLSDGRIASKVTEGDDLRFRVEVRGTDAVAESKGGDFVVMRRAGGPVGVAATEGTVALSAAGQTVDVGAGEQSLVHRGEGPSTPEAIPPSLYLKLGRPPPSVVGNARATVSGDTLPGAAVTINGKPATVALDGSFSSAVTLQAGANEITVEVEDLLGRRARKTLPKVTVVVVPVASAKPAAPPDAGLSGRVTWDP